MLASVARKQMRIGLTHADDVIGYYRVRFRFHEIALDDAHALRSSKQAVELRDGFLSFHGNGEVALHGRLDVQAIGRIREREDVIAFSLFDVAERVRDGVHAAP